MTRASKAEEAQQELVALLERRWGVINQLDIHRFWPVFQQFAHTQFGVPAEDDLLLFECSLQKTAGESTFYAGFIRQFSINSESGAYSHMEQMGCNFYYPALKHLRGFEETLWSDETDGETGFASYFSVLESLPVFQALTLITPERSELWNSKI